MGCSCARCNGEGPEEHGEPRPECHLCEHYKQCEDSTENDMVVDGKNWYWIANENFDEAEDCDYYEWNGNDDNYEPDYDDKED